MAILHYQSEKFYANASKYVQISCPRTDYVLSVYNHPPNTYGPFVTPCTHTILYPSFSIDYNISPYQNKTYYRIMLYISYVTLRQEKHTYYLLFSTTNLTSCLLYLNFLLHITLFSFTIHFCNIGCCIYLPVTSSKNNKK